MSARTRPGTPTRTRRWASAPWEPFSRRRKRCGATGSAARFRYTGEPAEKGQGSKVAHGLRGYYDDVDALISFHPFYMLPLCSTVRWDKHCGAYFSRGGGGGPVGRMPRALLGFGGVPAFPRLGIPARSRNCRSKTPDPVIGRA
ncbi:hypothetical protein ACWDKQ_28075 [Saccharopolyspora sp. NPDC000995]